MSNSICMEFQHIWGGKNFFILNIWRVSCHIEFAKRAFCDRTEISNVKRGQSKPRSWLLWHSFHLNKYSCNSFTESFLSFFLKNREYKLSYLSLRTSIGLWTSFLCILLVATDASSLVCYITRFTEEAFAALICIIFIYEALEKLFQLGKTYAFNMHSDLNKLTLYS